MKERSAKYYKKLPEIKQKVEREQKKLDLLERIKNAKKHDKVN